MAKPIPIAEEIPNSTTKSAAVTPNPDVVRVAESSKKASVRLLLVLDKLKLDASKEAKKELQAMLVGTPDNAIAQDLLAQLVQTPNAYLSEFPQREEYRLGLGDSWETLSQRVFSNPLKFIVLARLNRRKLSQPLFPGERIVLPLKPALTPRCETGRQAPSSAAALSTDELHQRALAAYKREKFGAAIQTWDQVLARQPEHFQAAYYRSKAHELLRLQQGLEDAAK